MLASSVGFGVLAWFIEIFGPEQGGIRIGEGIDYSKGDSKRKTKSNYTAAGIDNNSVISEDSEGENDQQSANRLTMEDKIAMEEVESPVLRANIYSRLTFGYLTPLMRLGVKRFIEEDDIWPLPANDSAEALNERLTSAWEQQVGYVNDGKKKRASLKMALFKAFGGPFVIAGILKAFYDVLSFLQPQLLRYLLSFVQSYAPTDKAGPSSPQPAIQGFAIAFSMFACANMATFLLHQYFERTFETNMRVRSALVMLIFKKSLVLSNEERGGKTTGDIVNLQSVDTFRIADLLPYLHIAWSGPFQVRLYSAYIQVSH
jgi:ATP-binding cassette subfamily C (CFTR/MRP) protein 1